MRTGCATCAVRETRTENSTSLGSSMAPVFCRGPQADGARLQHGRSSKRAAAVGLLLWEQFQIPLMITIAPHPWLNASI